MSNKRELFDALEVVFDLTKTAVSWRKKQKKQGKTKIAKQKAKARKNPAWRKPCRVLYVRGQFCREATHSPYLATLAAASSASLPWVRM